MLVSLIFDGLSCRSTLSCLLTHPSPKPLYGVDHVGVSNAQLVKEQVPIAKHYKNRSVAEQNSLDLSWNLLMAERYELLRDFLFPDTHDLTRFRQLVVNSVMSTDIVSIGGCFPSRLLRDGFAVCSHSFVLLPTTQVDKDMKALRNARWDKAFRIGSAVNGNKHDQVKPENERDAVNRKATIVVSNCVCLCSY